MKKGKLFYKYLNYYFSAKTRYAIHSPFVFDFVCNVINKKSRLRDVEALRKELKNDHRQIEFTDFGAGSINSNAEVIKVSDIARHSLKNTKYASLLFRIVNHFKPPIILELGTSLGISSCYMAKANSNSQIITIEGCPDLSAIAEDNAHKLGLKNISFIKGKFDDLLENIIKENKPTLIFFDGNHTEEATLKYFETCLPFATSKSIFIFDDINWSVGMKQAWEKIKANEKVKVTIDLFYLGIVFFRNELSKENFVIRF